ETGTQIAGHAAAYKKEEDQRADARHENRNVRVEAHEQRSQYRRTEPGHDVLRAHADILWARQGFVEVTPSDRAGGLDTAPAGKEGIRHERGMEFQIAARGAVAPRGRRGGRCRPTRSVRRAR